MDPTSEEVVLMKILQVLLACMKNKASVKLSRQHVCNIVNTCFQTVHQASSKCELLQRTARHTMLELIRCVFMHLPDVGNKDQEFTLEGRSDDGGEGVMMTRGNVVATTAAVMIDYNPKNWINAVYLAYLPLAHIFELAAEGTQEVSACFLDKRNQSAHY